MDKNEQNNLKKNNECSDILYIDGLFFIREEAIKENSDMVKNTLQDLYKTLTYN
ncbi:MAG: hypothetical protein VW378_04915 [bacterium]